MKTGINQRERPGAQTTPRRPGSRRRRATVRRSWTPVHSFDGDPGDLISRYEWDFGDGGAFLWREQTVVAPDPCETKEAIHGTAGGNVFLCGGRVDGGSTFTRASPACSSPAATSSGTAAR